MEIEFDFIPNLAARHSEDVCFLHFGFYCSSVWNIVRLDLLVDHSCVWQLHPECLELFSVQIALWCKLQLRWSSLGLAQAASQQIGLASTTKSNSVQAVRCLHWLHRLVHWSWLSWSPEYVAQVSSLRLLSRCCCTHPQQIIYTSTCACGCWLCWWSQSEQIVYALVLVLRLHA